MPMRHFYQICSRMVLGKLLVLGKLSLLGVPDIEKSALKGQYVVGIRLYLNNMNEKQDFMGMCEGRTQLSMKGIKSEFGV